MSKPCCYSIKTLSVRGAPAIGVAAAYGLVLALQKTAENKQCAGCTCAAEKTGAKNRLIAANCSKSVLGGQEGAAESTGLYVIKSRSSTEQLKKVVLAEADTIYREDVEMCRRIGKFGEKFIKNGAGILTHCNAGALATAGQGTALSVIYEATEKGKKV